jgi:hypothetical protein
MLTLSDRHLLRSSLVFVWLATAMASLWELDGQSMGLLSAAGVQEPFLARLLIGGGAAVDAAIGLALWFRPARRTYLAALTIMLLMTVIATYLDPALWLNPLGPLTKNIPIAAALWVLARPRS